MSLDPSFPKPKSISAPGNPKAAIAFGPLSKLEAALGGEPSTARDAAAAASSQIEELAQRTRQALAAGVSAEEFAKLSAVMVACEKAKEILDRADVYFGNSARM